MTSSDFMSGRRSKDRFARLTFWGSTDEYAKAEEKSCIGNAMESGEDYYYAFATLASDTRIDRKAVRRACRSLARKGLTKYAKGLWNEDGEPCGSGYGLTDEGSLFTRSGLLCARQMMPSAQCFLLQSEEHDGTFSEEAGRNRGVAMGRLQEEQHGDSCSR